MTEKEPIPSPLPQENPIETLRQSEEKYKRIFNHIRDVYLETGIEGQIIEISPSIERCLGYKSEELIGKSLLDYYANPEKGGELLEKIIEGGFLDDYEIILIHKNGQPTDCSISVELENDSQGKPFKIQGILRNITNRKKTEQALAKSEQMLKLMIDQIPYVIEYYQPDGMNFLVNNQWEKLYQASKQAIIGKYNVLQDKQLKESGLLSYIKKAFDGELSDIPDIEYDPAKSNSPGRKRWLRSKAVPIKDDAGKLKFVVIMHEDISDIKQIEDELKESEEKFRLFFDQIPYILEIFTPDGMTLMVNKQWEETYQSDKNQVIGKFNLLEDSQIKELGILPILKKAFNGEQVIMPDSEFDPAKSKYPGRKRWLRTKVIPIKDAMGEVKFVAIMHEDITERKNAEDALRESEKKYRNIFNSILDIYFETDMEGKIIELSPSVENITGYKRADLIGRSTSNFYAESQTRTVYIEKIIEENIINDYEITFVHKNGQNIILSISAELETNSAGMPIKIKGTMRDISARKRTGKELADTSALLEAVIRQSPVPMALVSVPDNRFRIINSAAREIYKIPEDEDLTGQSLYEFISTFSHFLPNGTLIPLEELPIVKALQEIETHNMEMIVERRDGTKRWELTDAIPIYNAANEHIAGFEIFPDITDRKQAEVQVQHQVQRLQALHSIDQIISSSLDLNFTLTAFIEQVIQQLRVDAVDVLLYNPYTQTLDFAAGRGFQTAALQHTSLRLNQGYAGQAAMQRRIVIVSDLSITPASLSHSPMLIDENFISYFGLPLIAKGQIKGVLEIFHRAKLDPDPEWFRFLEILGGQAAIAIDNATLFEDLQRSNLELRSAYDATLEGWARALELRDSKTQGHSQNVTGMTLKLAKALGVDNARLEHIRRGALLHDIGKMGIPDEILNKPGPLTEAEWEIMRQHPVYAFEMLYPIEFLRPALDIPHFHHEKWNGTGYPLGLKGEAIPLAARIFAVVDVWDALQSWRPYRDPCSSEETIDYLRHQSGKHFDPQIVDVFLKLIEVA